MQFAYLIKEVKVGSFTETRKDSEKYFEAVVTKQELPNLIKRLEQFFGAPTWPSKNKISSQIQGIIKDFGGIMPNQTLYFWSEGKDSVFAMLWPWGDGANITVKIGLK